MFLMRFYQKVSDSDMLTWLPFERDLYLDLTAQEIKKNKEQ